ncbi:MAG: hypothetical protein AB7S44_03820 [Spirochaetales bacterium]
MSNKKSVKFNINKLSNFILVITFFTIISVVLTSGITMAIFGLGTNDDDAGIGFGTILLGGGDISMTREGENFSTLLPGDELEVKFEIENTGTADMNIRFRIEISDANEQNPVDASAVQLTDVTAYYLNAQSQQVAVVYAAVDFSGTVWYVRKTPLIGDINTENNSPADHITVTYVLSGEEMDETYKNVAFNTVLSLESIQYANNGTQRDPTLPDYNVNWTA